MLFVVKERLEDLKYNIDFRGEGWRYTGDGDSYVHYAKKGPFYDRSVPTLLSLIAAFQGKWAWRSLCFDAFYT